MRFFVVAALLGLAAAQSSSSDATVCHSSESCSSPVLSLSSSSSTSSTPPASSSTSSTPPASSSTSPSATSSIISSATSAGAKTAITVAADGSGQFTAINAAVSAAQNSGIPTITVLPGTYSEAVTVTGTATVTIVGATASAAADWSQNQVTISYPSAPLTIGTSNTKGVTLRNINLVNSATTSASTVAVVLSLRGSNIAFYGCSIVSPGATAISASYGLTFFANSYIEGSDKIFYNVPTIYVYGSTIVPLSSGASIVYNKGATVSGTFYNSTVVFDSSSIQQKPGYTNTGVFLAAPNSAGAVAIYRNTAMGSLISTAGIHSSAATISSFYGEFQTTGAGSYAKNAASRASYDVLLTADTVSLFTIDKVYGNAFSPFGSSSLTWIDQNVLSSLQNSDSAQLALASSASSAASSTISASSTSFSSSTATASSTSAASTCSAAAASGTLVVSKNPGPCEYSNVTSAINALPNDSKAYTIQIGAGTYVEQLSITRKGKVTLIGATSFSNDYSQNKVIIEISNGRLTSANENELTPVIYSKKTSDNSGLAVYNIDFINTYPQTTNTAALAADFYGANIAAYGCSFIGFQDTLLANKGTQVFSNCYIEGSVDFIWGFSTAYFHQCKIVTNTPGSCIAAQSRSSADAVGGYVFDSCMVTYSSTYGSSYGLSYLGRPYSQFSIAVYMNSYIDKHIKDAGWSVWSTSSPQTSGVMFGEFNNSGPGSWQASTQRASFATNLTADQAAKYGLAAWIGDTTWLDMTAYNSVPSYSLTGLSSTSPSTNATTTGSSTSATTAGSTTTATTSGSTTTATINAHPDSGTIPPTGAVIVSVDGSHDAAFTNLTAALASLPKDSTNQTIFLYAGTYNEQIPSVNRPGAVRIIGYTTGNPGQSYKDNQVTITYSRGLSVSPLPTGHSNAETATFATASNRISLYNINMINSDNLDGAQSSYVTLAASIYGNDIAFHACSFDGWQDTLLTGATAGYQYYESCYIGGAIDFIWGYSKAYFKGCTIGAKRQSSAMTAHSRASSTAIGGYIFDQCLFTAAPDATVDLTNKVYLGRPYSQYALVVIKNSYISNTINPSGWKIWSTTDPRTDHITFAEYNNSGPSNWENNVAAREAYGNATLLTSDTYPLSSVMDSTEWIDMTYWNSIVTPQPAITVTVPTNTTVSGNSTFNGTTPPSGAIIVSKSAIDGVTTYGTIQDALNAAPTSSKTNATIFIYPGVYEEQLIVNKSGHTIFQGYSSATDDYSQNQVTIQFNHGIDTQGTSGSDTDGATVYATGNYFHAFNINFKNNNGTQQNIASLGFAVKSSKFAALYGCQIYGNQDTLDISGYLFTFKTYIEGNVDFIFGSGAGYFLDSTISPNEDGISITASKRTTNTTSAGFVFDQCTLKPAAGTGPFTNVGLGRPWNSNSRVAYVDCYLDSMISAAGWNQWSKSSPNTDGVLYGEYRNYGPGSNNCNRASFSQQLSDADVVQFQLGNFFASTAFIDFSHVDTQPFSVGIGSAQTCSSASSSVSSSSTRSSSISSSILSTSSIITTSSTSLPVITAYTTTTVTSKLTASTLITAPDVTSTTIVKLTLTVTSTGVDVIKTSTQKATATISITSPDVTSTSTSVVTENVGLTITPDPVIQTSTIKETITEGGVTTKAATTSTIKGTTTITALYTSTPKATTITQSKGSTVLVTSSIYPKGASTTVKTTISIEPTSTKTTTVKPKSSVTVSTVSYKTVTKKSTITQSCTPTAAAQRMVRRGAIVARAASTTTLTLSTTITSYVKTSTATQAGTTAYLTETTVGATKTTSLKGTTSTETITSVVETSTITKAGSTYYTTITSTSKIGKTTTLKASTTTLFSTSYVTSTSLSTFTAQAVTVSSFVTKTTTQTIVADQQTIYVTESADVTSTVKTTLPVSTTTKFQTITQGGGVATTTVTAASGTKTVTQKVSTTVVQWATKTAKC
ncbi:carbohydrate esterase family 8 protein [Melanomma pulvis-pyrius CBS 109.77]|uniref:pectinesterase n=1 Tax=Melanomma pulvis-pyrius CBS 109.77 TaxID=1314802 RepID=A0A6A6X9P0_9PLEO|nr:carbohydrate esterase family 8 protein [Melanomma pulvis-pyrius CBS 109.77]